MSMKYEDYLEEHCSQEKWDWNKKETMSIGLPWRVQLRVWRLRLKGILSRVTLEYHYHSVDAERLRVEGYGYARIHMYYPDKELPIGLEIEEGEGEIK